MVNTFESYIAKMLSFFLVGLIFSTLLKRAYCLPVFDPNNNNLEEQVSALIAANPSLQKVQVNILSILI